MVQKSGAPERMLTDDERALLRHWGTARSDIYPMEQHGGLWTWHYLSLKGPRMYATKEEATHAFEDYVSTLMDSARAESEQKYSAAPDADSQKTPDQLLLSAAISASGKSVREFSREVLIREPRTVWRWLAGENALPAAVREKCEAIVARLTMRCERGPCDGIEVKVREGATHIAVNHPTKSGEVVRYTIHTGAEGARLLYDPITEEETT